MSYFTRLVAQSGLRVDARARTTPPAVAAAVEPAAPMAMADAGAVADADVLEVIAVVDAPSPREARRPVAPDVTFLDADVGFDDAAPASLGAAPERGRDLEPHAPRTDDLAAEQVTLGPAQRPPERALVEESGTTADRALRRVLDWVAAGARRDPDATAQPKPAAVAEAREALDVVERIVSAEADAASDASTPLRPPSRRIGPPSAELAGDERGPVGRRVTSSDAGDALPRPTSRPSSAPPPSDRPTDRGVREEVVNFSIGTISVRVEAPRDPPARAVEAPVAPPAAAARSDRTPSRLARHYLRS